ncbi:MAG: hypothetical protein QOK15_1561 [Nocardioidaceae bacterium]|jgi:signal transduction histidine kinase|nr:hypothetical protein [Nocardioidaceae bacterium]
MWLTDSVLRRLATWTFVFCGLSLFAGILVSVVASRQPGDLAFAAVLLAFPVVGVLVARRQPRNRVGWTMLAVGVLAFFPTQSYADLAFSSGSTAWPLGGIAATFAAASWAPTLGLVGTFVILLFPDGHLPSPRWRFVGWWAGFAVVYVYVLITFMPGKLDVSGLPDIRNPLGIPLLGRFADVLLPSIVVLPIAIALCAAGLVQRFRRSTGIERLQVKWLATAGAVVATLYLAAMVGSLLKGLSAWDQRQPDPQWLLVIQTLAVFSFILIPISIGVAILKHGLYEIDVVINKTLVLATLAFFITAVYVAIVVGVGRLVGGGDRPNLALSVAATAVVAVLFQPVRDRVQKFANRLVYGERATPYEVLSDFADRVGGSYDAAELLPRMARTVAEGVGAARVEVWLATQGQLNLEAAWPTVASQDAGEPVGATEALRSVAELGGDRVVEVRHQGELLGALTVLKPAGESLNTAEEKLLDDVAAQAGLVLRNVRLIEDLRTSRERLVTTQDEERRRLERNLHDGAQQSLVSVALMVSTARSRLSPDLEPSLGPALDQAAEQLRLAVDELRELARGIHPAILTERGLEAAIGSLAERSPVPVQVDYRLERRPSTQVEASLYYVVAEALTNVAKYASATGVSVTVTANATPTGGTELVLEVTDDGIGGADASRGSGLRGLADRVAVVDGTVHVDSPVGGGTRLVCRVPLGTPTPVRVPSPLSVAGVS